jgi:hypothetical protein
MKLGKINSRYCLNYFKNFYNPSYFAKQEITKPVVCQRKLCNTITRATTAHSSLKKQIYIRTDPHVSTPYRHQWHWVWINLYHNYQTSYMFLPAHVNKLSLCWWLISSGLWHYVTGLAFLKVLKGQSVFTFTCWGVHASGNTSTASHPRWPESSKILLWKPS